MSGKVITVKSGSASVKIHIAQSRGNSLYTVAHYHGGRRVRKVFAGTKKGASDAGMKAHLLQTGELQA